MSEWVSDGVIMLHLYNNREAELQKISFLQLTYPLFDICKSKHAKKVKKSSTFDFL